MDRISLRCYAAFLLKGALVVSAVAKASNVTAQATHLAQDQSGISSGPTSTPVYDGHHRPITRGGFALSGARNFEDATKQSGLANWKHTVGSAAKQYIVETAGSGVALLDYDNDGWLDIYLVNGSTVEAEAGHVPAPQAALFHNNHDGTFTNVAVAAGVTNDRWGFGVAVGDYDNDGWPDLYVTNIGKNRLFHNNHDGTFTDVAPQAGVEIGDWSTGATFGDYDGDGRLDLFVPGYVHFDLLNPPRAGTAATSFHSCEFRGVSVSCGPRGLEGARDHLFHNNGDGTFTDVSEQTGVGDAEHYYGFTSLFVDVNADGKPDLLVANDSTPNYFYANQGNGTFLERGRESGFAFNREGREVAGMGLAVGDYLNNGQLDLALTNFSDDYKLIFRNDGGGEFTEVSNQVGLADNTSPFLGWGVGFIDYDNDGWKDLMMVNGHIYPVVDLMPWGTSYEQRPLLFHNHGGKGFTLVPAVQGSALATVTTARGAAFGDLFNDGRIDAVVNNLEGMPTLMRDVNVNANNWIEIKLIGGVHSPRDAVGATVFLKSGKLMQREDVLSGGSFMSSNDQRVHFGLGLACKIENVSVHWPSGAVETISLQAVNTIYTVAEGQGVISSASGEINHTPRKSRAVTRR